MNIKFLTLLVITAFLVGGCDKSPTSTANKSGNQPPAPIQAEAQSGTLSRKAAEALITKAIPLPRVEQKSIPGPYSRSVDGSWYTPKTGSNPLPNHQEPPEIAFLQKLKLVTTSGDGNFGKWASGEWAPGILAPVSLDLTDEGKKYSSGDGSVKICDLVFGEITGIIVNDQTKTAIVEFSLRRTNWTPFGDCFKRTFPTEYQEVINIKAEFQQYDDGWRFKNISD